MTSMLITIVLIVALLAVAFALYRMRPKNSSASHFDSLARQSGFDPDFLRPFFWVAKVVLALLLPLIAMNVLHTTSAIIILPLAVVGFFLPDLVLYARRSSRRNRILQSLSFYLDLVVSFLRSGLTLEESVNRAALRGLPPKHPLAEEVQIVAQEIAAGKDRAAAFGSLAKRTNIPDLHAMAAALELGSRLGFPVADILATQADVQREKRAERGKRRIDRASIMALFPVILCGFPLFTLVVVVPIVMQVFETFRMIKGLL